MRKTLTLGLLLAFAVISISASPKANKTSQANPLSQGNYKNALTQVIK